MVQQAQETVTQQAHESAQETNIQKLIDSHTKEMAVSCTNTNTKLLTLKKILFIFKRCRRASTGPKFSWVLGSLSGVLGCRFIFIYNNSERKKGLIM